MHFRVLWVILILFTTVLYVEGTKSDEYWSKDEVDGDIDPLFEKIETILKRDDENIENDESPDWSDDLNADSPVDHHSGGTEEDTITDTQAVESLNDKPTKKRLQKVLKQAFKNEKKLKKRLKKVQKQADKQETNKELKEENHKQAEKQETNKNVKKKVQKQAHNQGKNKHLKKKTQKEADKQETNEELEKQNHEQAEKQETNKDVKKKVQKQADNQGKNKHLKKKTQKEADKQETNKKLKEKVQKQAGKQETNKELKKKIQQEVDELETKKELKNVLKHILKDRTKEMKLLSLHNDAKPIPTSTTTEKGKSHKNDIKLVLPELRASQDDEKVKAHKSHAGTAEPVYDTKLVQTDLTAPKGDEIVKTHKTYVDITEPVEDKNVGLRTPKTYSFQDFYRDHTIWVGAVLGIIFLLSLIVIGFIVIKIVGKYRRFKGLDIKNFSFSPFKDRKLDESPMYIRLSHINNPKSGNHYIVSVLDDRKDENEWSSEEEEVFNISGVKPGSPAIKKYPPAGTSTPIGTPVKNNNNSSYYGYYK